MNSISFNNCRLKKWLLNIKKDIVTSVKSRIDKDLNCEWLYGELFIVQCTLKEISSVRQGLRKNLKKHQILNVNHRLMFYVQKTQLELWKVVEAIYLISFLHTILFDTNFNCLCLKKFIASLEHFCYVLPYKHCFFEITRTLAPNLQLAKKSVKSSWQTYVN